MRFTGRVFPPTLHFSANLSTYGRRASCFESSRTATGSKSALESPVKKSTKLTNVKFVTLAPEALKKVFGGLMNLGSPPK